MSLLDLALHKAPLLFLDVETTGLRPELGDRMVEIAVLKTDGLSKKEQFSSLINPQRPLDRGAMAVNGITPAMVADAPTFAEIIPRLQPLFENSIVVAHNAPFDLGFLQNEYNIAGVPFSPGPVLDTVMLARKQYNFYSNSLGNIAKVLNIATPDAHRAMGDVLTTYAVFRRFSGDLTRQNRPLVSDWIRMQGGIVWQAKTTPALKEDHPIQIALTQSKRVKIQYQIKNGATSQRIIRPISTNGEYVVAFCELRRAQRTFRLDRITTVELLDE